MLALLFKCSNVELSNNTSHVLIEDCVSFAVHLTYGKLCVVYVSSSYHYVRVLSTITK